MSASILPFFGNGGYAELTSGSGNWVVPDGVFTIHVLGIGGGQGGGWRNLSTTGTGGNGGEFYQRTLSVTPGQLIPYTIGVGGAGGGEGISNDGFPGTATVFGPLTFNGGGFFTTSHTRPQTYPRPGSFYASPGFPTIFASNPVNDVQYGGCGFGPGGAPVSSGSGLPGGVGAGGGGSAPTIGLRGGTGGRGEIRIWW